MQLIIDISEEDYKALDSYISFSDTSDGRVLSAVKNGIPPLDKKIGHWIGDNGFIDYRSIVCSECGRPPKYCPHCNCEME